MDPEFVSPIRRYTDHDNPCGGSGRTHYQDRKKRMTVIRTNKDKKSREDK